MSLIQFHLFKGDHHEFLEMDMNYMYVKVDDGSGRYLIPLNGATFEIDDTNLIHSIYDLQGDRWNNVYSFNDDNDCINIEGLKCNSIEELIVVLDVHNCLYHFDMKDTCQDSIHSKDSNVAKLKLENVKLKKQLKAIKNLVKTA